VSERAISGRRQDIEAPSSVTILTERLVYTKIQYILLVWRETWDMATLCAVSDWIVSAALLQKGICKCRGDVLSLGWFMLVCVSGLPNFWEITVTEGGAPEQRRAIANNKEQ
jgi:hypothetical protein